VVPGHRALRRHAAQRQGSVSDQLQQRATLAAEPGQSEGLRGAHAAVLRHEVEGNARAGLDGARHSREGQGQGPTREADYYSVVKRAFYLAIAALIVFEVANVWFIMPLPYSQRVRSLDVAYALYAWRWWIRGALAFVLVATLPAAWSTRGWRRALVPISLIAAACVAYMTNVTMSADHIFIAPASLTMKPASANIDRKSTR